MNRENPAAWPFFRDQPDMVVLTPRGGVPPSGKPPVRIFLGTEEAQHRAERVFFWSIEKVRDPARTYEIHLMKNLTGFDRRHWRTGFTNYRYAIPELAGGTGKAIYNDVDQIYLADPALLFDIDMEGHGYRAIDASDTSVMLIDCARMLPMWNRKAASAGNKYALLAKPRKTPGLWGAIDPHWNARDQEYLEGRTKCLHYTALHQQPWEPFPDGYSYHPNPLAWLWHGLEREADAEGYHVFEREHPSPTFRQRLAGNAPAPRRRAADRPSPAASALAASLGVGGALRVCGRDADALDLGGIARGAVTAVELRGGAGDLPAGEADLVAVHDLLERVPPADLGWLLDELMGRARTMLYVALDAIAFDGLGSPAWWRRRLDAAAARHPGLSWITDITDPQATLHVVGSRRGPPPAAALVWTIATGAAGNAAAGRLAAALGDSHAPRTLAPEAAATAGPPWPDVVVTAAPEAVPAARRVKAASDGAVQHVHLGAPRGAFAGIDLIVAQPDDALPIRANVLQATLPLAVLLPVASNGGWAERLVGRPRPIRAVVVSPGERPRILTEAHAAELGRKAGALGEDGTLLVLADGAAAEAAAARVATAAGRAVERANLAGEEGFVSLITAVDELVLTTDQPGRIRAAAAAGRTLHLFPLPYWYDTVPALRSAVRVLRLLSGGGTTYRGTPHQQHAVGRWQDALTVRGWRRRKDDMALPRALVAHGLARWLGEPPVVAALRPPDDLDRAVERVRGLLSERPIGEGAA